MKKLNKKQVSTYLILGSVVFLVIAVAAVSVLLRSDSESSPIITTKIRASSLTYRRTITIGSASTQTTVTPTGSAAVSPSPTSSAAGGSDAGSTNGSGAAHSGTPAVTATATPTDTPEPTAELTASESGTTDTPMPSDRAVSPTPVSALPETGTWQYTSILFIAASVVLFISFLF